MRHERPICTVVVIPRLREVTQVPEVSGGAVIGDGRSARAWLRAKVGGSAP